MGASTPSPLVVRDGRGTAHILVNAAAVAAGARERRAACGWPIADGAPVEAVSTELGTHCLRCLEVALDVDHDESARSRPSFAREMLRRTRAAFSRGVCRALGRHRFGFEQFDGRRAWSRQCTRCGAEQEVPESWL